MTDKEIEIGSNSQTDAEDEAALICKTLFGKFRGVEIDFRHPLLVAGEWEPAAWWHVWGPEGANISFAMPGEIALSDEEHLKGKDWRRSVPFISVEPGDTIMVTSVELLEGGLPFDHEHDNQIRLANLNLIRANGDNIRSPMPLAFFGSTRIRNAGCCDTFDHMLERLRRHLGIESFDRQPIPPSVIYTVLPDTEMELSRRLVAHGWLSGGTAYNMLKEIDNIIDQLSELDRKQLRWRIRTIINATTSAAFSLAKMEGRDVEKKAKKNLQTLAAARKASAAKTTNFHWRNAAKAHWAENPADTVHATAKVIAGPDDDLSSVQRSIKQFAPLTAKRRK